MNWMQETRGPQWKHGWSSQTLASISTPPLHLLTIFTIVVFLLFFSRSADYKADTRTSTSLFFTSLILIAVVCIVAYMSLQGGLNFDFQFLRSRPHQLIHQTPAVRFSSSFPWGVAGLLVFLLLLLSF